MNIDDNIKNLKSVGPKRLKLLNNIGIFSIKDLLCFYPRRYEDSSKILKLSEGIIGEKATFRCRILSLLDNRNIRSIREKRINKNKHITKLWRQ